MSTVGTAQRLLLPDGTIFTGTQSFRGVNQALGRTLVAVLKVNSFEGGSPPNELTLSLHGLFLDGTRFPAKLNSGMGTINMPGTHVMVFGPIGDTDELGNDRTDGRLPRNFEVELSTTGNQGSADVMLELAYL